MKAIALLLAAFVLSGCGGTFEEARNARISLGTKAMERDPYHCQQVDNDHTLFVRAAWVDGSIAGATGAVAGALPGDVPKGWPIALGTTSAVAAAMAVYATTQANAAATQYVQECSQ